MTQSYPLALSTLQLTIAGQDRTAQLIARTLQVQQVLNSQSNTCRFTLMQPGPSRPAMASIKPSVGQELLVQVQTGSGPFVPLFGGFITRINEVRVGTGVVQWAVECTDYTALLTRHMVRGIFSGVITDIVTQILQTYAPRVLISTTFIEATARSTTGMAFNYSYPKDCLDTLAKLIGYEWYMDASQYLHFFNAASSAHVSPNTIADTSQNFFNLAIEPQLDQVRNRIWVQGGNSLSDFLTETFVADGGSRFWTLQNANITQIAMTIDGVPQTIAQAGGTNAEDDFAFTYVQNNDGTTTISASAQTTTTDDLSQIVFTYRYQYPINVMVEDTVSQAVVAALAGEADGIRESLITDSTLTLVSEARAVGDLELAQWSQVITQVTFTSYVPNWATGDMVTLNVTQPNTGRTFSGTALIQNVSISAEGNQLLRYDVQCSASRFNLIDFYLQLVQQAAAIAGTVGSDIAYITNVDDSNQAILIDGPPSLTNLGTTFHVKPDWGSGTTPYITCEYWVVDPTNF